MPAFLYRCVASVYSGLLRQQSKYLRAERDHKTESIRFAVR